MDNILHITNGDSLTDYLKKSDYKGTYLTWREMLCEGPLVAIIDSEEFFNLRSTFLKEFYNVESNNYSFKNELNTLNHTETYAAIVLWFEYDLFCHINMLGAINLLQQKNIQKPIYIVISGFVGDEKSLKGLCELNPDQLQTHYNQRVELTPKDKKLAMDLWKIYCGTDHHLLASYPVHTFSFKYLNNCLKAHIERFPNQKTGLNVLETTILKTIRNKEVKSERQLLRYMLNDQGYYGFGDIQLRRMIHKLDIFFELSNGIFKLNSKGHGILSEQQNFMNEMDDHMVYGGAQQMDFRFHLGKNQLVKSVSNAN